VTCVMVKTLHLKFTADPRNAEHAEAGLLATLDMMLKRELTLVGSTGAHIVEVRSQQETIKRTGGSWLLVQEHEVIVDVPFVEDGTCRRTTCR